MKLKNSHSKFQLTVYAIMAFISISFSSYAESLSYSGRLVNSNGSPVAGPVNLKFELANSADTSTILCSQQISNVTLTNGVFHVKLDLNCGTPTLSQVMATILSPDTAAIRVTNESPDPDKVYSFQSLHAVPSAQIAHGLSKLNANNNEVLTWTGSKWEPKPIVGATGGTVTDITAGSGLSGGTITNSGTIAIDIAGVTDTHLAGNISRSKLANGTPNYVLVNDGLGVVSELAQLSLALGGTGATTAAGARTNLGLGTAAVANIGDGPGNVMSASAVPNCLANEKLQMSVGPVYAWTCVQDNDSLDGTKLPLAGGTMTGAIDMGTKQINNLGAPTVGTDAATKDYVDTKVSTAPGDNLGNHTATANLAMGSNKIFLGDGAWNNPSLAFTNNTNTGLFNNGGILGFSSSGSLAMNLSSSSLIFNGSFSPYLRLGGGTHGATGPAYSFNGDSDTGMFNLSTDILGFTTGGVEKMRIFATGEVAIGKSSAAGKLDVAGNIALEGALRLKSDTANYVELRAPASLGATVAYTFPPNTGSPGYALTTNGSGVLSWSSVATTATAVGGDISGTIANAQLVANSVGTSEIANSSVTYTKLNLADGDVPQAKVANLVNDLAGKEPIINAGTTAQYWRGDKTWQTLNTGAVPESTNLYFTQARVMSSLLGTYSTGAATPLSGVDTLSQALGKLEGQIIANQTVNDSKWDKSGSSVYYNDGNVGIGTANPGDKLEILGGSLRVSRSNLQYLSLFGGDGTNTATYIKSMSLESNKKPMIFQSYHDGTGGAAGSTGFQFYNGTEASPVELMRLSENGNLGVGVTNPLTKLDVNGSFRFVYSYAGFATASIYANGTGYGQLEIAHTNANTDVSYLSMHSLGNTAWTQGIQGSNFVISNTSGAAKTYNDNERLTITAAGSVGIGTTNPQATLEVNGGIKLGSMTACGAAQEGSQRYNSTLKIMEFCNGTVWGAIGSPAIPTGAIMAFDLASCPSGWSEYTVARGRFLRGIDNGAGQDPSGTRAPGSYQADGVQDHAHNITGEGGGVNDVVAFQDSNGDATYAPGGNPGVRGDVYIQVGGMRNGNIASETRPKNVAVLFCRKN
ncbi:hypothetical protein ACJVC5_08550 [Peredibacter sp. HCB2-198]|uniref:hypothetical protein n=1 Tax=Peredibacter sp. HCB2-198 TaxID=3383025 RepID=UPI0038B69080